MTAPASPSPTFSPAPVPAPSPTTMPDPASQDVSAGADALKDAVAGQSMTAANIIEQLDAFGFTLGDSRFSLWTALVFLLVVAGLIVFARLGSKLAQKLFNRFTALDVAQRLLGEKLLSITVWALALMIGIDVLGIDLTALAVFSGAFGLAIGFGLQKTFGNLISGIILLMDRSIKPGDVIAVSDQSGRESFGQIRKIGIRAISVVTRDKKEYLIPNENLMINQVENWSYSSRDVRVKAPLPVALGTDIELAEALMLEATRNIPRVLDHPEPRVLMMGFSDNAIEFEIRFWIRDPEEGVSAVRSDVYKKAWTLFRENGIEVPFPQRDLNLRDSPALRELVTALSRAQAPEAGTPGTSG